MLKHRILVADPDHSLLTAYKQYLTAEGFVAATARTGSECVERLFEFSPNVLVLDPKVLGGSAEGFLGMTLDDDNVSRLHVIILTEPEDDDIRAELAPFPVAAWHVKPFGPAALTKQIRSLLGSGTSSDVFVTEWAQDETAFSKSEEILVADSPV